MQSINNNYDSVYCKQFYRIFETVERSEPNNFWIVLHGRVFDLSSLTKCVKDTNCKTNRNYPAIRQLAHFGGSDLSELFEDREKTKLEMFMLKSESAFGITNNLYWWNDPTYEIGRITERERHVCIWTQSKSEGAQFHLTVCEEDSIYCIQAKFHRLYANISTEYFVWRKNKSTCCASGHLFLDKTLTENGLKWSSSDRITFLYMIHKDDRGRCTSTVQECT